MSKTQKLVYTGLLVGITVVLARFLSIKTDLVRMSFEFLSIAVAGALMGPLIGGITAVLADIIGGILFPHGAFFPGFTLSAFLTGVIYGLFLYKQKITWTRAFLAAFVKTTIVDLVLVTIWLLILYQMPLSALLAERLIKYVIILPLETVIIFVAIRPLLISRKNK